MPRMARVVVPGVGFRRAGITQRGNRRCDVFADDAGVRLLRQRTRTGRPCGGEVFVRGLEALLGRRLLRRKPGPKPKRGA